MSSLEKSVGYVHVTKYWDVMLVCPHSPQELPVRFIRVSALWDVLMLRTLVLSSRDLTSVSHRYVLTQGTREK